MDSISFPESQKILRGWMESVRSKTETVPTRESLHRVLSAPAYAVYANPTVPIAAMDGIAIDFRSVSQFPTRLKPDKWQRINTGEPVPPPFNAVVKIENVKWEDQTPVLEERVEFYQHVRDAGEDFESNFLLLNSEHHLQPPDLSLLLAAGCEEVEVYRRPIVSFLPTGSELAIHPSAGKVVESNSAMIAGLVESWGGVLRLQEPIPDDPDDLAQMIKLCSASCDVLVISAGTSKGTRDITIDVLRLMGKVHFHGVSIAPGKPLLFAEVDRIPVLGLPGYPAAAYIVAQHYLRHLVCSLSHVKAKVRQSTFISAEEIAAREMDSFHRVNVFEVEGQTLVRKIRRGAGSIVSLSQMDGWMHVPPNIAIHKRDAVRIDLIQEHLAQALTIKGVSDPSLYRLFDLIREALPDNRVLFWESSADEALQSIIERSLHVAIIDTPTFGPEMFTPFARQLQERMWRYRAFTRTIGLIFVDSGTASDPFLPGLRIAMPEKNEVLWHAFLENTKIADREFLLLPTTAPERALIESLHSKHWDAVFADIRFLRDGLIHAGEIKEHVDVVIPEGYADLPGIRKLIELLLSDEYAMWVESQKGCDVRSRGLMPEHLEA